MRDSDTMILAFLRQQRQSVLAIVDGMSDTLIRTPALPSGWTSIGLINHLADVERSWVQHVAAGVAEDSEWDPANPDAEWQIAPGQAVAAVLDGYRRAMKDSDRLLAELDWDAPNANRKAHWAPDDVADVRWVVLHLIEETARHAGHLDAARELLDGQVGRGPN